MKRVSIVILTYNSENDVYDCVDSIRRYADIPLEEIELIVVDNNSRNPQPMFDTLYGMWEDIVLIENTKNGGYGQGNNVGVRAATAPVVMIMNPDVRLCQPVFQKALASFEIQSDLVMYGMKQMVTETIPSRQSILWTTRVNGYVATLMSGLCSRMDWYFPKYMYISGACFFVRKSMFEGIGLFDEDNFMYGEEDDIRVRLIRKYGSRFVYDSGVHYLHLIGERNVSQNVMKRMLDAQLYLNEKNGYSRSKTLTWYIQNVNVLLFREWVRCLFGSESQNMKTLREWKGYLIAQRNNN